MNKKKIHKILPEPLPPEEAGRYVNGRYYPEYEAYYHICPATFWGFFGRKNQIYLKSNVKSAVATLKRANLRARPLKEQKAMKANDEALRKNYQQGKTSVFLITLFFSGFDTSVKSKIYKNRYGKEIKFFFSFGFYLDIHTNQVRIFRKTFDYQLYENFDGTISYFPYEQKKFLKSNLNTGIK